MAALAGVHAVAGVTILTATPGSALAGSRLGAVYAATLPAARLA